VKKQNLNMRAILIHIVGDFLGSIGVAVSGVLETYLEGKWEYRFYVDPIVSVMIAIFILSSAIPILRSCAKILLQTVPSEISPSSIKRRLERLPGVKEIHEFHIWQLHESKIICSMHVILDNPKEEILGVIDEIKTILHRVGIHSSTIQPEIFHLPAPKLKLQSKNQVMRARMMNTSNGCNDVICQYDCSEHWCCPPNNHLD